MEQEQDIVVSVLTPCRNNPAALADTLDSICEQRSVRSSWNEVIVIDGSDGNECREITDRLTHSLSASHWRLRRLQRPAQGIYDALNAGLALSAGRWVQVMPASDRFWGPHSLQQLVGQIRGLNLTGRGVAAAVFGQAWVEVPERRLGWLTPDPRVASIDSWLRRMVPCHQAMLFDGDWARAHPYPVDSPVYGDRPVMRAALAMGGPGAYLAQPVCRFRLGGISSGLPDGAELRRRLSDPCLDGRARRSERVKALLGRITPAQSYPHLMRLRAAWLGWRC